LEIHSERCVSEVCEMNENHEVFPPGGWTCNELVLRLVLVPWFGSSGETRSGS